MPLATFKHIASKNADYNAAEAYLLYVHNEFTNKPTRDDKARLVPQAALRSGRNHPREKGAEVPRTPLLRGQTPAAGYVGTSATCC